jgi:hypothetical protein
MVREEETSLARKAFPVAGAVLAALFCAGPPARADARIHGKTACLQDDVRAVEEALGQEGLQRRCEAMQARYGDLDLTYGELMYRQYRLRRDAGAALLAVLTPVFVAASVGLGIAAHRAREEHERLQETEDDYSSLELDVFFRTMGSVVFGIAAIATLFGGTALVLSGVETMPLLEPLLTSDPSTWNRSGVEVSLAPLVLDGGGGGGIRVSF